MNEKSYERHKKGILNLPNHFANIKFILKFAS